MTAFAIGDVVRLMSAGPAMTVSHLDPDGLVKTAWFRHGEYREGYFDPAILFRLPNEAPAEAAPTPQIDVARAPLHRGEDRPRGAWRWWLAAALAALGLVWWLTHRSAPAVRKPPLASTSAVAPPVPAVQTAASVPPPPPPSTPAPDPAASRLRQDFEDFLVRDHLATRLSPVQRQALFDDYLTWHLNGHPLVVLQPVVIEYDDSVSSSLEVATRIALRLGSASTIDLRPTKPLPAQPTIRYAGLADRAAAQRLATALADFGRWDVRLGPTNSANALYVIVPNGSAGR